MAFKIELGKNYITFETTLGKWLIRVTQRGGPIFEIWLLLSLYVNVQIFTNSDSLLINVL